MIKNLNNEYKKGKQEMNYRVDVIKLFFF